MRRSLFHLELRRETQEPGTSVRLVEAPLRHEVAHSQEPRHISTCVVTR